MTSFGFWRCELRSRWCEHLTLMVVCDRREQRRSSKPEHRNYTSGFSQACQNFIGIMLNSLALCGVVALCCLNCQMWSTETPELLPANDEESHKEINEISQFPTHLPHYCEYLMTEQSTCEKFITETMKVTSLWLSFCSSLNWAKIMRFNHSGFYWLAS